MFQFENILLINPAETDTFLLLHNDIIEKQYFVINRCEEKQE